MSTVLPEVAIFVDANIVMHAEPFESQQWHALLPEAAGLVTLVLCGGVLKEVDDLATAEWRGAEVQTRASTRRRAIRNIMRDGGKNLPRNVRMEVCALDDANDRDNSVLRAIGGWTRCPALLATNDGYLALRADAEGIRTIELPERPPMTSTKVSIEQIRGRLEELTSRLERVEAAAPGMANLVGRFEDGSREATWRRPIGPFVSEKEKADRRDAFVKEQGSPEHGEPTFQKWLREEEQRRADVASTFDVRLVIENESSSTTAEDIRVKIRFRAPADVRAEAHKSVGAAIHHDDREVQVEFAQLAPIHPGERSEQCVFWLRTTNIKMGDVDIDMNVQLSAKNMATRSETFVVRMQRVLPA